MIDMIIGIRYWCFDKKRNTLCRLLRINQPHMLQQQPFLAWFNDTVNEAYQLQLMLKFWLVLEFQIALYLGPQLPYKFWTWSMIKGGQQLPLMAFDWHRKRTTNSVFKIGSMKHTQT